MPQISLIYQSSNQPIDQSKTICQSNTNKNKIKKTIKEQSTDHPICQSKEIYLSGYLPIKKSNQQK